MLGSSGRDAGSSVISARQQICFPPWRTTHHLMWWSLLTILGVLLVLVLATSGEV
jgi:hypothetical protein